jgi:hypothetical protein
MIDDKTLALFESAMTTDDRTEIVEVIRNARRYLALRKVGVQVPGYEFVKFDRSLDAAADRLVEGGE